ncbi:MAG TPA: hypothetical protein VK850_03895 [Candidatus Binatia bacterium]|nr:hypothetical protein [Candidatus Binatia bacterium]
MSSDEHQILELLKTSKDFFSVREVSKRVGGKRRCQKEPTWAKPCLIHLANSGHIQMNEMGHFRYLPEEEKKKKAKPKLHVSPQIAEILARSGKPHLATVHELQDESAEAF